MRAIASILCVALAAAQAPGQSLQIETPSTHRRGLVIGNAKYAHDPLDNPVNDATSVGKLLRELGFAIDLKTNVDKEDMDHIIDDFVKGLGPGDVALFYYAGHGFQIEGVNYLVPIDFNAWNDAAKAKYRALSASEIIERMEHSGTRLNIAIVDACRTNLGGSRGVSVGLASMNTGDNTFVALATAQGKAASDSAGPTGGKNGLFTAHLLEALQVPGLNLDDVFNQTREKVVLDSKSTQRPWTGSSVVGKFYFRSDNARTLVPPPVPSPPATPTVSLARDRPPRTLAPPPVSRPSANPTFSSPRPSPSPQSPSLLKMALDLRAAHKPKESLDAFTREIRQNPRGAQAFFERGKLYASLEQYDAAIVDFTDTLRLEPDNAVAYHARGVAYLSKGEYLRALPDLDQAAGRLPRDATVFFNRGIAYARIDRQQQAIESYNQALAIRPDYADAFANRAFSYASSGKLRQALEDCNQAIHLKPSLGATYRNRAKIKRLLGDPAGALADEELASTLK